MRWCQSQNRESAMEQENNYYERFVDGNSNDNNRRPQEVITTLIEILEITISQAVIIIVCVIVI